MEEIKKLTQAQRAYFVKRIDGITLQKMSNIWGRPINVIDIRYRNKAAARPEKSMDKTVLAGIVSGKIKLLSKKDAIARMKKRIDANTRDSSFSNVIDFIDQDSLVSFNKARNIKLIADGKEQDNRIDAVKEAASELKDKVMLEGSLAIGMLEKFEKKEF